MVACPGLIEADAELGLCAAFARCRSDWRKDPSRSRHRLETLIRQGVFPLVGGDQDYTDPLCSAPLFQLVCGQLAVSGRDLASQPPTNPRWEALAQDLHTEAVAQRRATGAEKGRLISEAPDQAGSWDRARRIIDKAEALPQSPTPRFVVTTRTDPPQKIYDHLSGSRRSRAVDRPSQAHLLR